MYKYEEHRDWLGSLEGQRDLLRVRDWVHGALKNAGAFTLGKAIGAAKDGDSFRRIALVDRLVELDEIEEVPGQTCASQHRIYRGRGERWIG